MSRLFEKQINSLRNNNLLPSILNVYIERYSFSHFFNDIFAGIKIFILLFPVLISLSIACGESPISGLVSGIVAMVISSVFGGTRYQISSISFPICVLYTEIMIKYQYKGVLITSVLICIILFVFGKLKIGDILRYTASAFLSALYVYTALLIFISQLQYILGINHSSMFNTFFSNLLIIKNCIGNISLANVHYTLSFLGLLIILKFIFKGYIVFFVYLLLCAVIMLCSELNLIPTLGYLDIKTIGIGLFNYLNSNNILLISYTLPSQLVLSNLVIFAFAISLVISSQVSFCTNIGACITFDKKIQTSIELISIGIANVVSVCFGGLFVSPDNELSIQNIQYKSKSVISTLITAFLIFIVWYFKDYIFQHIPIYAISSILIILSISAIRNINLVRYLKTTNNDKYVFWSTLIIALYFGFVPAVFIGFVLSLFMFSHRMVHIKDPSVYSNRNHDKSIQEFISNKYGYLNTQKIPKSVFDEVEFIQIDNVLSLNLLEKIRQTLSACGTFPKFIIIYFQNIPFLDGEAMRMLQEFVRLVKKKQCVVMLCGTNGLLLEILQKKEKESNIRNVFGYIIPNFQDAITKIIKSTKSS